MNPDIPPLPENDHDTIVALWTIVNRAVTDIRDLHKDIAGVQGSINAFILGIDKKIGDAVDKLEIKISAAMEGHNKDDAISHGAFDRRLRFLERYVWVAVGGIGILNLLVLSGVLHLTNLTNP